MNSFALQSSTEIKLFVRDPGAAFFTLAFPVILLVANNSVTGDGSETSPAVPMLTAMVLGMIGMAMIPAYIAEYRHNGVLRRLMATPTRPVSLLMANAAAQLLLALLAFVLLLIVAAALYGDSLGGSVVLFAMVWLLGAFSLASVGFLVAALAPTARSATGIGFMLFFPMMYLSGAMVPKEALPDSVATAGTYTPMGPVTESLREVWEGGTPSPLMLVAMAGVLVVCSGVAARTFRW